MRAWPDDPPRWGSLPESHTRRYGKSEKPLVTASAFAATMNRESQFAPSSPADDTEPEWSISDASDSSEERRQIEDAQVMENNLAADFLDSSIEYFKHTDRSGRSRGYQAAADRALGAFTFVVTSKISVVRV